MNRLDRLAGALIALIVAVDESRLPRRVDRRDERGSVTTEHVLWAVAVIAIVGIVVAAVKAYVELQAGKIK
jgi:heme/copper-type cytochrome/quinol oxidase subunit 2